jgi:hypothetical protein
MYVPFSVFCVLFVCKFELYCCHRVSTQLQLNISYRIISYHTYLRGLITNDARCFVPSGTGPPYSRGFLDHTQQRTTVGRTPLDEWSVRCRDLYLTTHITDRQQCPRWDSSPQLSRRAAADQHLRPRGHAMCTVNVKISSGFPWQKRHSTRRKYFRPDTVLQFNKEPSETLCLEHSCWRLLEIDGEVQLCRSRDKWDITWSQWGKEHHSYRVIQKSLRDVRPLRYSSQDGHAEG